MVPRFECSLGSHVRRGGAFWRLGDPRWNFNPFGLKSCFTVVPGFPWNLYTKLTETLRWGWVFLERTRILSEIQFTTYFIKNFVVETKGVVVIFVHVILTRQTCGQRSSRAAESKRRALGNCFSERICYMFLISKCRGDRDLGLCPTSVLSFSGPQCNGKIRFFQRRNTFLIRILPLRCGPPNASTEVVHRPRSQSHLHFDIGNI